MPDPTWLAERASLLQQLELASKRADDARQVALEYRAQHEGELDRLRTRIAELEAGTGLKVEYGASHYRGGPTHPIEDDDFEAERRHGAREFSRRLVSDWERIDTEAATL